MNTKQLEKKIEEVLNNTQHIKMSNKLKAEVIAEEVKKFLMNTTVIHVRSVQ
jgi:hypothetical protein